MKIPFVAILKWIGTTLLAAAVQEGAERLTARKAKPDQPREVEAEIERIGKGIEPQNVFVDRLVISGSTGSTPVA